MNIQHFLIISNKHLFLQGQEISFRPNESCILFDTINMQRKWNITNAFLFSFFSNNKPCVDKNQHVKLVTNTFFTCVRDILIPC